MNGRRPGNPAADVALSELHAAVDRFNADQAMRREGYIVRADEGLKDPAERESTRAMVQRKAAFLFPQYHLTERVEFDREEDA